MSIYTEKNNKIHLKIKYFIYFESITTDLNYGHQ